MSEFDELVDRRGSGSIKWAVEDGELPMWVADMDFKAPECVRSALAKRVEHGVFGYCEPDQSWRDAYVSFYHDLFNWNINGEDLIFILGVVAACSSSVRALTEVGDKVVVFPPVYNIFYNSILNSHREAVEVPLLYHGGAYSLDFESIERAFSDEKTKLCIFCNPHNPVGKIYSIEELKHLADLARKHGVYILSDEIHGPVAVPPKRYVPFLSIPGVEDVVYAAFSPTKAFNLAGIHTAALCIPSKQIRAKVERRINTDEVAEPNVFSCVASIAALSQGRQWLENMNHYVAENRKYAEDFIAKNIPSLHVVHGEATYLLWVDCRGICPNGKEFAAFLRRKTGLFISGGEAYGKGGEGFVRINLAAPRSRVEDGMSRLRNGAKMYLEEKE